MDTPLLDTKLLVPSLRSHLVARPHLMARLTRGMQEERRLTLVSAPAGFGKTTLVSAWLHTQDRPVAWLSLDEGDNDPVRFLIYLVAALRSVDADIGRTTQALIQGGTAPRPELLLTPLLNDLAARTDALILVLDDYHVIRTQGVHQFLTFLLQHPLPLVHLVLLTRQDPPLPLARLRARGQVTDVRQADLQFGEGETADFLRRTAQLDLPAEEVAALQERTEGWVAGLQLAALSMRTSDDPRSFVQSFTGSDRYILDYLMDEVLLRLPDDVQDFVLKTSLLDRLTPPLCDAVTGRQDGREMLVALERMNAFVVPLDTSRQWYRYHHLFADLLRHRLRTEGEKIDSLHRRASAWYATHGFPAEGIRHALAAEDWDAAARLIQEASTPALNRGETLTLLGWFEALPDEVVRARPRLCLEYAWALLLTGRLSAAASYLAYAEEARTEPPGLWGEVLVAQAYLARAQGEVERAIDLSHQASSLLAADKVQARSIMALNQGLAHWQKGQLAQAAQAFAEAEQASRKARNRHAQLTALAFQAQIHMLHGRLHWAHKLYRQALRSGEGDGPSPAAATAYAGLCELHYEWNDLASAAPYATQALDLSRYSGRLDVQLEGYRLLARVRQAQRDAPAALEALEAAHRLAAEWDVSPLEQVQNAACHVEIALAHGDLDEALRWEGRLDPGTIIPPESPFVGLTRVRLLLAQGEKARAAERLDRWFEAAGRLDWQPGLVEARVLQALVAPTYETARPFLAEALAQGRVEGYVRTFVDEGAVMAAYLRQAVEERLEAEYAAVLLRALEEALPITPPARPELASSQVLVEPLTEREEEVLGLLAKRWTNREIAQALVISINTVKAHLKNIYGKLDVHNRRQAVARARELGLL